MIRHAVNLLDFTINFDTDWVSSDITKLLSCLGTRSLEKLEMKGLLGTGYIDATTMTRLLQRHRNSLRTLDIKQFTLGNSDWKPILEMLSEFSLLGSFHFLYFFALREGRSLVHFPIASHFQEFDGTTIFTCRSRRRKNRDINILVSCQGPKAKAALRQLCESMETISLAR